MYKENNQLFIGQLEKLSITEWIHIVQRASVGCDIFILLDTNKKIPFVEYVTDNTDLHIPERDGTYSPLVDE